MDRGVDLYNRYHRDRHEERLSLFRILRETYGIERCLYPGSYVHVTPSFVFPHVTYIDSDQRVLHFYTHPAVRRLIEERREYPGEPEINFIHADYRDSLPVPKDYDLLLSQFAGFVSNGCNRYLRTGGILLANDSHGDASLAATDPRWTLIAVVHRSGDRFFLSQSDLGTYFVPRRGSFIDRDLILRLHSAIPYVRVAAEYVFRKSA